MTQHPKPSKDFNGKLWLKSYPAGVDYNAPLPARAMGDVFDESVAKYGDRTFINFLERKMNYAGKSYTYKEIGDLVNKTAAGMQANGIKKGDKVGLCMPNTPYYVINYYAAMKIGATVVNLNPLMSEDELIELSKDANIKMMVTLDAKPLFDKVKAIQKDANIAKIVTCDVANSLPTIKKYALKLSNVFNEAMRNGKSTRAKIKYNTEVMSFKSLLKHGKKPTSVAIDPLNDVAVYQYTGGTTGLPKAAMLTHANLTVNTEQNRLWFGGTKKDGDKMFAFLPFFHVFSMTTQLNLSMATGSELTILLMTPAELQAKKHFEYIAEIINNKKPTVFAATPQVWKDTVELAKKRKLDLSSLKICLSGGAALPAAIKTLTEDYVGQPLIEGYGLSETSPVASANPVGQKTKAGSIGLTFPGTEIELRDLDDPSKTVPLGQKGEIWIKGPQVMKGYFNNPKATKESLDKDGWFRTGDVATMDEDGYVFIVDRIKDMILSNTGNNVYPSKIEKALSTHPDIDESLVIGVPDAGRGETIKAFIVLKKGATEFDRDALKSFLKSRLKPYEIPKMLEFRDELPKTMIGKPDRKALRAEETAKTSDPNPAKPPKPQQPPKR